MCFFLFLFLFCFVFLLVLLICLFLFCYIKVAGQKICKKSVYFYYFVIYNDRRTPCSIGFPSIQNIFNFSKIERSHRNFMRQKVCYSYMCALSNFHKFQSNKHHVL